MNWLVGPIRRNESEYDILKDGEHMYGLVVGLVLILLWGEIQGVQYATQCTLDYVLVLGPGAKSLLEVAQCSKVGSVENEQWWRTTIRMIGLIGPGG